MKLTNTLSTTLLFILLTDCGPATVLSPQPEPIAFEVCGESSTWTRPSQGEQKAKWWDFGRYTDADEQLLQYPWTHSFFVAYGQASDEYDLLNLSGLWTLAGNVRTNCLEPDRQDAILKLKMAEVWVLLHKVKSIRRVDTDYYLVVEPTPAGVQFVQFARPERQAALALHFVTEDGQALEQITEADSPYWPYPELTNSRKP